MNNAANRGRVTDISDSAIFDATGDDPVPAYHVAYEDGESLWHRLDEAQYVVRVLVQPGPRLDRTFWHTLSCLGNGGTKLLKFGRLKTRDNVRWWHNHGTEIDCIADVAVALNKLAATVGVHTRKMHLAEREAICLLDFARVGDPNWIVPATNAPNLNGSMRLNNFRAVVVA
jgi:hypothetical protein